MLSHRSHHPQFRRAPPARRRGLSFTWSPDVLAATVAITALAFLPMLGSKAALMFLCAGMALIVTAPDALYRSVRREWLLVLMTAWCVISFAWSDYPSISLRHGIQLVLTVLIALAICQRITPRVMIKIFLAAHFLAGMVSLMSGRARADGMGFLGIYGSKNALAAAMGLLFLLGLAVLLDRKMSWRWRLLGLSGAALGLLLLVMGQSAGALVAIFGAIAAVGPILLLQRMNAPTRLVTIALSLVLLAAGAVLLSTMVDVLAAMFLDATGKDVTLTGRTDLWRIAFGEIAQRPLLGAGFQAVWVQGNPLAEQLWDMFGIESRGGFNFHNTLISNAVEIGLVGIAMQAALFFTAVWFSMFWAIRSPSAASLFLALFMVRQALSMMVEVVFFFQFDVQAILMVAALHYGRSVRTAALREDSRRPAPRIRWRHIR